jgi:hypothetical protein
MTLCPIAVIASCKQCPAFSFCPAKSIIGDHKAPVDSDSGKPSSGEKK